jgi:hypothetical protein
LPPVGKEVRMTPMRGIGGDADAPAGRAGRDGHTLASGNNDGTIRLRNVADPAHPRRSASP